MLEQALIQDGFELFFLPKYQDWKQKESHLGLKWVEKERFYVSEILEANKTLGMGVSLKVRSQKGVACFFEGRVLLSFLHNTFLRNPNHFSKLIFIPSKPAILENNLTYILLNHRALIKFWANKLYSLRRQILSTRWLQLLWNLFNNWQITFLAQNCQKEHQLRMAFHSDRFFTLWKETKDGLANQLRVWRIKHGLKNCRTIRVMGFVGEVVQKVKGFSLHSCILVKVREFTQCRKLAEM